MALKASKLLRKISDSYRTPDWLFKQLDEEFHFDIDLCATKENKKVNFYCSDYLNENIRDFTTFINDEYNIEAAFMNPPYSNPKPFIEKAWEDSKHCKIVCLVKCDPSTKWWATFWEYKEIKDKIHHIGGTGGNDKIIERGVKRGPKPGCEIRFFPKRIQFDPPQELIDSGEVWKEDGKWFRKCADCNAEGYDMPTYKGLGYKPLPGPTFPCALLIFDRRGL